MEAELYALSEAAKTMLYIRNILDDLSVPQDNASILYEDNQGCVKALPRILFHCHNDTLMGRNDMNTQCHNKHTVKRLLTTQNNDATEYEISDQSEMIQPGFDNDIITECYVNLNNHRMLCGP